jgi:hypothetical protein
MLVWIPDEKALCRACGKEIRFRWGFEAYTCKAHFFSMNRRRSERVALQMRLVVVTEFEPGKLARVDAFTLVVNAHGGLLEINMRLPKGQKLLLSNPSFGVEQRATVVAVRGPHDGGFAVAFEFENAAPNFWPISFPPKDWDQKAEEP